MTESSDLLSLLDQPEINNLIFYPRRDDSPPPSGAEDHLFPVEVGVRIGGRFYLSDPEGPHLLFFHGNGEIAADYDDAGLLYQELGLSLLALDYRGYGKSDGRPSIGTILSDAVTCFDLVYSQIREKGRPGPFLIMGRSLGSAPAIEVAFRHLDKIAGLIIESGFATSRPLLELMGIPVEGTGILEKDGFDNIVKISKITKPTFILHAQYDELIPLEQADLLLKNSGARRKELMIVPRAGHNDIIYRCGRTYFETIARFANSLKPRGRD